MKHILLYNQSSFPLVVPKDNAALTHEAQTSIQPEESPPGGREREYKFKALLHQLHFSYLASNTWITLTDLLLHGLTTINHFRGDIKVGFNLLDVVIFHHEAAALPTSTLSEEHKAARVPRRWPLSLYINTYYTFQELQKCSTAVCIVIVWRPGIHHLSLKAQYADVSRRSQTRDHRHVITHTTLDALETHIDPPVVERCNRLHYDFLPASVCVCVCVDVCVFSFFPFFLLLSSFGSRWTMLRHTHTHTLLALDLSFFISILWYAWGQVCYASSAHCVCVCVCVWCVCVHVCLPWLIDSSIPVACFITHGDRCWKMRIGVWLCVCVCVCVTHTPSWTSWYRLSNNKGVMSLAGRSLMNTHSGHRAVTGIIK